MGKFLGKHRIKHGMTAILFFIAIFSLVACQNNTADVNSSKEEVTSELSDVEQQDQLDIKNLKSEEYRISALPGKITVDDNYNVYSTDNEFTEEMCSEQEITYEKMQQYVELKKSAAGIDMLLIPANEPIATTDFEIEIKVKDNKDYGIDNIKDYSDEEFKIYADTFMKGFSTSSGSDSEYSVYENDTAKFIVFNWEVMDKHERRYATILNGKMVYFIAECKSGAVSDLQDNETRAIIDSLKY